MEISPWLIYFIDVIHSLCIFANAVFIGSIVAIAFLGFTDEHRNALKISLITFVVSGLLCLFVPSKSVMVQMLVIPPIVNNESMQELPQNLLDFINDYLKEARKEMKEGVL